MSDVRTDLEPDPDPGLDWSLRPLGWIDVISSIAVLLLVMGVVQAMGLIHAWIW